MTDVNIMLPEKPEKTKKTTIISYALVSIHPSLRHPFLQLIQPGRIMRPVLTIMSGDVPTTLHHWMEPLLQYALMSPWKHTRSSGWRGVSVNPSHFFLSTHTLYFYHCEDSESLNTAHYITSLPNIQFKWCLQFCWVLLFVQILRWNSVVCDSENICSLN